MKNSYQNKKGVALITVVMFFLVMVILLSGLLFSTVNNLDNTQTAQKHTSVYYAAESGINLTVTRFLNVIDAAKLNSLEVSELTSNINDLRNEINEDNQFSLKDNFGKPVSAEISISDPFTINGYLNYTFFKITSIGRIDNIERTLTTNFGFVYIVGEGNLADITGAIIVNGSINIDSGYVQGPIASNMEPDSESVFNIKHNNSAFKCSLVGDEVGDITLPQSSLNLSPCPSITKPLENPIVFGSIGLPPFPNYDKLTKVIATNTSLTLPSLSAGKEGFYVEDLNINTNGNFVINLGNWAASDTTLITLRIKKITYANGINFNKGTIVINGKGRLQLLIDQTADITISTNINIDDSIKDPNKFMLILRTNNMSRALKISNNMKVVSSILTDSTANIDWKNMEYYGFLVSNAGFISGVNAEQLYEGVVNFQAGSASGTSGYPPIWIYAPYANIHLQSAGTKIYGTVMGNSFSMSSQGGGIIYEPNANISYPFDDWTPLPQFESGDPVNSSVEYIVSPIKEE